MKPPYSKSSLKAMVGQLIKSETYNQIKDYTIGKFRDNDYRRLPYDEFEDPGFPGLKILSDLNSKRVKSNVLYKYVSKDTLVHILAPNGGIMFCVILSRAQHGTNPLARKQAFFAQGV